MGGGGWRLDWWGPRDDAGRKREGGGVERLETFEVGLSSKENDREIKDGRFVGCEGISPWFNVRWKIQFDCRIVEKN